MLHDKEIAILTPYSLLNRGLETLLTDFFAPKSIAAFDSIQAFEETHPERFDLYLLHPEFFTALPNLFLPRKQQIILLSEFLKNDCEHHPYRLSLRQDEESTIESLEVIFGHLFTKTEGEDATLSPREMEVVELVVKGLLNKEIAEALHISINTVLTHRKNISSKLGIKTVSGLTFYALMNGLLK